MAAAFDPYYEWLGISAAQQPVSHYRLLGVEEFEASPAVIERAWRRQTAYLESCRVPTHEHDATRLLEHLHQAARTLLDPQAKREYDGGIARAGTAGVRAGGYEASRDGEMAAWLVPAMVVGMLLVLGLGSIVGVVLWSRALAAAIETERAAIMAAEMQQERAAVQQAVQARNDALKSAAESDPAEEFQAADPTDVGNPASPTRQTEIPGGSKTADANSISPAATSATSATKPSPSTTVAVAVANTPADPSRPVGSSGNSPANGSAGIRVQVSVKDRPAKPAAPAIDVLTAAQGRLFADRDTEWNAAKTPADKQKLATQLLGEANQTTDAAQQLALLREAQTLAVGSGDTALCLTMLDEVEQQFDIDESPRRLFVLKQLAESAEDDAARWTVARALLDQAKAALDARELPVSLDYYQAAKGLMDKIKSTPPTLDADERMFVYSNQNAPKAIRDPRPIAPLAARAKPVADALAEWEDAEEQRARLAATPDAPTANLRLGKFLCFTKGDWDEGLPHLSRGSSKAIAAVADAELAGAAEFGEQANLGDQWHELAASSTSDNRTKLAAMKRARHWYDQALPGLTGQRREDVRKRLAEMPATTRPPMVGNELVRLPWLDGPAGEIRTFDGHEKNVTALAVTLNVGYPVISPQNAYFVPNVGCYLASAAEDGTVRVWNLETGRQRWKTAVKTANVNGVAFSTNGGFVIANYDNNQIGCWNPWPVPDGDAKPGGRSIEKPMAHAVPTSGRSPTDLLVTPDGRRLIWATRAAAPNIACWDTMTNQAAAHFGDGETPSVLDVSLDGRLLAAGDSRGMIRLWQLSTGMLLSEFSAHQDAITDLDIAPDGRHVASASFDEICVSTIRGEEIGRLYEKHVRTVAFSPDGRRLISGGIREEVFLWDLITGERMANLKAEAAFSESTILRLAFLPDPRGLVTGATDGKLRLWKLPD